MSDDDADDFIAFGKALKPLEDDAIIRKKPIAVEEQIGISLQDLSACVHPHPLLQFCLCIFPLIYHHIFLQFVIRMVSGDSMERSLVVGLPGTSTRSTHPKAGPRRSLSPPGRTKGTVLGRGLKILWMMRIVALLGLQQRL